MCASPTIVDPSSGRNLQELPNRWFALQVRSRHEKIVAKALAAKGFDEFLPVRRSRHRWCDRYKDIDAALFPGYVFCRFNLVDRLSVAITPGVVRIVGAGGRPLPVDDSEIVALRRAIDAGLDLEPQEFLEVGTTATITDGPLRGLKGILLQVNRRRKIVLSVTLLQRSVSVTIDHPSVTCDRDNVSTTQFHPSRALELRNPKPLAQSAM